MSINLGSLYRSQEKDKQKALEEYQERVKILTAQILKDLEDKGLKIGEVLDVCSAIQQTLQMQFYKKSLVEFKG